MFSNRSNSNHTFNATADLSMLELRAARKIKVSPNAFYALTEFLQHSDAEAEAIVSDPVYTDSDMKLIAAISPMLARDLILTIDSFYLDEPPQEPASCVEVLNRMVESFPLENIVLMTSNGNYSIYENGPNLSRGLIRRLLRAKQFGLNCELERIAAQEYYHSVEDYENSRLADEDYQKTATLAYPPAVLAENQNSISPNLSYALSSITFKYVALAEQNDLASALVAMSLLGVCALYVLRRPANCLRQGVASVLGLFKDCNKTNKTIQIEEEAPTCCLNP